MAAMRRAKFILAASPILVALFAAPFLHTHFGMAGDPSLSCREHAIALHHAHFPEERGASARENNRHADLDHSSHDTKPFVLLANLSPAAFRDLGVCLAATPIPVRVSLIRIGRVSPTVVVAAHGPPWRGLLTLRAPPVPHSV